MGKRKKNQKRQSEKSIIPKESINTSSNVNIYNFKRLVKRIFSFEKLMIVATLIMTSVGVYYSYITYVDNLPVQISVEYRYSDKTIQIHNGMYILSLLDSYGRYLSLSGDDELFKVDVGCPFPTINNTSKKGINNFKCDVDVELQKGITFNENHISRQFEISNIEHIGDITKVKFHYKSNVLHAKTSISTPINDVYFSDSLAIQNHNNLMIFNFHITYDGIPNAFNYCVMLFSCFNSLSDSAIDEFLSLIRLNSCIFDKKSLIMIRKKSNLLFCKPIDQSTDEIFEKYKLEIIKKYRDLQ